MGIRTGKEGVKLSLELSANVVWPCPKISISFFNVREMANKEDGDDACSEASNCICRKTPERDKAKILLAKVKEMLESCSTQDDLDAAIRFTDKELDKYRFSLEPLEKIELSGLVEAAESRLGDAKKDWR